MNLLIRSWLREHLFKLEEDLELLMQTRHLHHPAERAYYARLLLDDIKRIRRITRKGPQHENGRRDLRSAQA